MYGKNKFLGYLYLVGGFVLLFLAAGELVLRLTLAVVALYLINMGLSAIGQPNLILTYRMWKSRFWF